MAVVPTTGPHLVIAGAARSGTSYLASVLSAHPQIDPGAVKEPNYFSRELERGQGWYDGLYQPSRSGLLRLDASVSYTFPQFPSALPRLAAASPGAVVVYVVREPIARAFSHYQLHRDYFGNDSSPDFGAAIRNNPLYLGASDYARWLPALAAHFPVAQRLVVPFPTVTAAGFEVANLICRLVAIDALPGQPATADAHRNDVVQFRHGSIKLVRRWVKRSGAYPWLRRSVGTERLRSLRSRLTRKPTRESLADALATCDAEQVEALRTLYASARAAATAYLGEQDSALGLDWTRSWADSTPQDSALLDATPSVRGRG